ncbi:MAG: hypothetical protein KAJ86_07155 [Alphaproteobacteria bacterium]|nr:hypothetical protein [Alphaproteobacteria bacterium]
MIKRDTHQKVLQALTRQAAVALIGPPDEVYNKAQIYEGHAPHKWKKAA